MNEKKVTISIRHPKNIFIEKLIKTLIIINEENNLKYVYKKALNNLKKVPFELSTISDLKEVQGFGENISVQCFNSWDKFRSDYGNNVDLKTIDSLTTENLKKYISHNKESKKSRPQLPAEESNTRKDKETVSHITEQIRQPITIEPLTSKNLDTNNEGEASQPQYTFETSQPSDNSTVILIADSRENNALRQKKTVVEHLSQNDRITFDMRTLSVGDYVWICRKIDGTEIVMDWVVERKTWSDLKSSIFKGRYAEQKNRIEMAPFKYRIYLIESSTTGDVFCEQALMTTMISGGYMIQRCSDVKDTASFLIELTAYLQDYASKNVVRGVPLEILQNDMKKSKAETVKELWTRQLMVCPGMSYRKAELLANKFPTMMAMKQFFAKHGDDAVIQLMNICPQITRPVIRNITKFFVK